MAKGGKSGKNRKARSRQPKYAAYKNSHTMERNKAKKLRKHVATHGNDKSANDALAALTLRGR